MRLTIEIKLDGHSFKLNERDDEAYRILKEFGTNLQFSGVLQDNKPDGGPLWDKHGKRCGRWSFGK